MKRDKARGCSTTRRCRSWCTSAGSTRGGGRRLRAGDPDRRPARGSGDPGYDPRAVGAGEGRGAVLAGMGWQREDTKLVQQMASNGAEPIGSLGYDGPSQRSPWSGRTADYFKETVAVVTNPAIDRERDRALLVPGGVRRRPSIDRPQDERTIETAFPIILGGHHDMAPLSTRRTARWQGAQDLPARGPVGGARGRAGVIDISCLEAETAEERSSASSSRPRRRCSTARAAGAVGPHRVRRRAALARPAPRARRDRPRAARVPRRGGRGEPAPPHLDRAALRRDPQRARRLHGARPRRRRRVPT